MVNGRSLFVDVKGLKTRLDGLMTAADLRFIIQLFLSLTYSILCDCCILFK